jgi:hypothetical protein
MKSHDYHVLMTQILPVAIRGIMDEHVRQTLFGLCNFFDVNSRKSISVRKLDRLHEEIVVILCELEMYFPPAFFDFMVHLLVHIVEDIVQLGPMLLHSMVSFKRMNGVIKGYVHNRSCPDGSIMQPGNRMFHGRPMPSNVLRVQVARMLRGCDHVMPPFQPKGDEDEEQKALR